MRQQDLSANSEYLFTDAASTWSQLLVDISKSSSSVLFENYIWHDGDASDALLSAMQCAKKNGAIINITIDAIGSFLASSKLISKLENIATLTIYNKPRFGFFQKTMSSLMRRTHRRIIVCDNSCAWVGGLAVNDFWWKGNSNPCRETMLRISGDLVAQLRANFHSLLQATPRTGRRTLKRPKGKTSQLFNFGPLRRPTFLRLLLKRIGESQRSVYLATAYFIPPLKLRRALIQARRRGVTVHLQLPSAKLHDHPMVRMAARRHYSRLLKHGVVIYEYTQSFQHSKTALFDGCDCLIGSPNIDRWSFFRNHEILVESTNPELCEQLKASFDEDMRRSVQIDPQLWQLRSIKTRLLENFAGIFDPIL
jgi:cardiolipin synthase